MSDDQHPTTAPAQDGDDVASAPGSASGRRPLLRRRSRPPAPTGEDTAVIVPPPDPEQATGVIKMDPADEPPVPSAARLRRHRRGLMAQREQMLFHLGGLTFELFRHGRLGEPVARHRAEMVAELDDAVRVSDEQLLLARSGRRDGTPPARPAEVGSCLACRAPFYEQARFCMQCGERLAPVSPGAVPDASGHTQVLETPAAGEATP